MVRRYLLAACLSGLVLFTRGTRAQEESTRLRVNVVLVQLNVAVTDSKGNYISGLKPQDFIVTEDKIQQKIATFEAGGEAKQVLTAGSAPAAQTSGHADMEQSVPVVSTAEVAQTSVFILFDTSNYMYRGFVYAQDAIADFVRSLDTVGKVAIYAYNRNLSRVAPLTDSRSQILHGVRNTVAGDDAALYDSLLMTVKDAAHLTGRKAIVVFSNGPDNSSLVPPEDVTELAQSTGTTIYMISTRQIEDEPISGVVFQRMSKATGGKAYFSRNWQDEAKAFADIRDDLGHLYSLSYYPQENPNHGWRNITVKLAGKELQKYRVRTRDGYRPMQVERVNDRISSITTP